MTPDVYQAEVLSRLDLGLWAVVALACVALFCLGVLIVKAVW